VDVTFSAAQGDLNLYVYSAQGQLLGSSTTGAGTESVTVDRSAGGTYLVQVSGAPTGASTPYAMSVKETGPSVSTDALTAKLGEGGRPLVVYTTSEGTTVRVRLNGPGAGRLNFFGDDLHQIIRKRRIRITGTNVYLGNAVFRRTTSNSAVSFTTAGGTGRATIGGIAVRGAGGALNYINAPAIDVLGDVDITKKIRSLVLGDLTDCAVDIARTYSKPMRMVFRNVTDVMIHVAGRIRSILAQSWWDTDATADQIACTNPSQVNVQVQGHDDSPVPTAQAGGQFVPAAPATSNAAAAAGFTSLGDSDDVLDTVLPLLVV